MPRLKAIALMTLGLVALAVVVSCCPAPPAQQRRIVAPCSWSYFGDPRAVSHGSHVFTGCIGTDGRTVIEDYDLETGRRRLRSLFAPLEPDDHNNPGLVFFRKRLYVFSSPHSGYRYPLDRLSRMRYRVSRRPWAEGGEWGPARTVRLGSGCGLGYTYPNPVVAGDRLYLFMRGPCWTPYFTSTTDGLHWARARSLVDAPPTALHDGGELRRPRAYAKYSGTADGSIAMAFSDGHPSSFKSSLYYLRFKDGRFYRADGGVAGTLADLPLRFGRLDRIQGYSPGRGRAWPMDVAHDRSGAPVVVYSSLVGADDTFRYARWDGTRWRSRAIAAAGRKLFTYHNSGIALDHADPSRVVLSRTVGAQNEIELRQTTDHGRSWRARLVTSGSRSFNIRPVIPRGLSAEDPLVVLHVSGSARTFREYDTYVVMSTIERNDVNVPTSSAIHGPWARWMTGLSWRGVGSRRRSGGEAWASSTGPGSWTSTATSRSS
jgi:hypothetical protein